MPALDARYRGGGEVLRLAVAARQRLVRDALDERLDEPVLAALGRARVGVQHEHLLARERREHRLECLLVDARERRERRRGANVLPSTAASWSSRRSSGVEPVEPRGDQRVQRLGHVERRRARR